MEKAQKETSMQTFLFESNNVRVVMKDEEPWFVAKDVAEVLGYVNSRKAIADHCKAVDTVTIRDGSSGNPNMTIIPERDMYRLIMRSKLPAAERFEEWVVGEVLPSIRKYGAYATQDLLDRMLEDPDYAINLLQKLKYERQQKKLLEYQRDEALRTKALIGNRREATAMATASNAVQRCGKLEDEIGNGKTWKQCTAMGWVKNFFVTSRGMWSVLGRKMATLSVDMGYEVRKIENSSYGTVNAYHVNVWEEFRSRVESNPEMMWKYRKA